jgi:hypothetical protein
MKKTILFLSANPSSTPHLRLEKEMREIQDGLRRGEHRDRFDFQSRVAVRPRDISRALLDTTPNIIHFSGHGSGEEGLIFENESGTAQLVNADALSSLFELFADQIECIVLNACYSEIQAEAIVEHIPFVTGMNAAIGDRAAIEFSISFYDAIVAGKSIEFAYKLGRNAIQMAGVQGHLIPVLKTKNISGLIEQVEASNNDLDKADIEYKLLAPSRRFLSRIKSDELISYTQLDLSPDEKICLKQIQLASLQLLLSDQLDNGGWGKTWLYQTQSETLPVRLCTFGGTSLAIEALSICLESVIPRVEILKELMDPLLNQDGIYYQTQRKATIGYEKKPENIRHIAGGFLLRSSHLGVKSKDCKTIQHFVREANRLQDFAEKYDPEDLECLDLSMVVKSLLNALYLTQDNQFLSPEQFVDAKLGYYQIISRIFSRTSEKWQTFGSSGGDVRLLWGFQKVNPDSFGLPLLQWWTIWNMLPVIYELSHNGESLQDIDSSTADQLISWIETFLVETIESSPDSNQLLPASYIQDLPNIPVGESAYSTAMALLVCNCLELFKRQIISKQKLSDIRTKLLRKLCSKGILVATHYPLQPYSSKVLDTEGYFTWIAILLAFKTLGFTISQDDVSFSFAEMKNSLLNPTDDNSEIILSVHQANSIIQDKWRKSAFTYDDKMYIKLKKQEQS